MPSYYQEQAWRAPLYTRQLAKRIGRDYNLRQLDAWSISVINMHCVLFQAEPTADSTRLLENLRADQRISGAQLNAEFEAMVTQTYNDPLFTLQYGKKTEAIKRLHAVTQGASSIIGLIDGDIDRQHPDLYGQVHQQSRLNSRDQDDQLHGTAMAGIIVALPDNGEGVVGIAPSAKLMAYSACRSNGTRTLCQSFDLAKAIAHAIHDNVHVLNISLAGPQDALISQLLTTGIEQHGMIVVAATNQDNQQHSFPANMKLVHAADGVQARWFARSAQMSTQAGGGYQVFYGSSVASAGIAAIAGLLRAIHSSDETKTLLHALLQQECNTKQLRDLLAHELQVADLCD